MIPAIWGVTGILPTGTIKNNTQPEGPERLVNRKKNLEPGRNPPPSGTRTGRDPQGGVQRYTAGLAFIIQRGLLLLSTRRLLSSFRIFLKRVGAGFLLLIGYINDSGFRRLDIATAG
jgi:hypothetical protein